MASFGTKLTLLKQRIIGGGEEEANELTTLKQEVFSYPPVIKKARKGISHWLEGVTSLRYHCKLMSKSVVESDVELEALAHRAMWLIDGSKALNVTEVCNGVTTAVNHKLEVIEELHEKASLLDDYRLSKNRLRRKIEEARKRGEKGAEELKEYESELAETTKLHSELYNEVMGKLEFFKNTAAGRGGIGLIWAELNAFKHAQLTFFHDCAVVFKAHENNTENDPIKGWQKFEAAMNEAVKVRATRLSLQYQSSNTTPVAAEEPSEKIKAPDTKPSAKSEAPAKRKPPMPPARQKSLVSARALYDYEPQSEGDIALKTGDIISVTEQNENGWWKGTNNRTGESGFFPGNYCDANDEGGQEDADV